MIALNLYHPILDRTTAATQIFESFGERLQFSVAADDTADRRHATTFSSTGFTAYPHDAVTLASRGRARFIFDATLIRSVHKARIQFCCIVVHGLQFLIHVCHIQCKFCSGYQ